VEAAPSLIDELMRHGSRFLSGPDVEALVPRRRMQKATTHHGQHTMGSCRYRGLSIQRREVSYHRLARR
jgi:hypothetical protein